MRIAPRRLAGRAGAFLRESRGGTSLLLAIGGVVLVTTAAALFDIYTRVGSAAAAGRVTAAMTDYIAREAAPDGDQIQAFGQYLQEHHLGAPADVVFVISAIWQDPNATDPEVLWAEAIEVPFDPDDRTVTAALAADCGRFGAEGGAAKLPDGFPMASGEVVVVTETCARLRAQGAVTSTIVAGDIYRVAGLPPRDPTQPPLAPVFASTEDPVDASPEDPVEPPSQLGGG